MSDLGKQLMGAPELKRFRLTGSQILSSIEIMQAKNDVDLERAVLEKLSAALSAAILQRIMQFCRIISMDGPVDGKQYKVDLYAFDPSMLEQCLEKVWQEGYNARSAEVS